MSIRDDYDLNNIMRIQGYTEFGKLMLPFFTGDNWDKLDSLRNQYIQRTQKTPPEPWLLQGASYRVCDLCVGFAEWFEEVYLAIETDISAKKERSAKMQEKWEESLEKASNVTGEQVDQFWKGVNEIFNKNGQNQQ
jgi:hypothetical protein